MSEPPKAPEEPEQPGSPNPNRPLARLQAFLRELKTVLVLSREVFIEFKNLLVIIVLIVFFLIGVYEALSRLPVAPQRAGESVSRSLDRCQK